MAGIFNLAALSEGNISEYNFVTNKTLLNHNIKDIKKQFVHRKDLFYFLISIEQIFSHSIYIRNQIFRHCKNLSFKKDLDKFKETVYMLSYCDIKMNYKLNLHNNLKIYIKFFQELDNHKIEKKSEMYKNYEKLKKYIEKLKLSSSKNKFDDKTIMTVVNPILDGVFLKKIYQAINDLIVVYNEIRTKLLELEIVTEKSNSKRYESLNYNNKKNTILYYGFCTMIYNMNNLHKLIKNQGGLLDKLQQTNLFN